jgi:hypothetical protein
MTSALLNMLETPEETSAEVYSEDGTYHYAIDEDDASRLIGGLSLESQAPTEIVSNLQEQYNASQWASEWPHRDEMQDMIHPFMQARASIPQNSSPFQRSQAPPNMEHHPSDFGQYLP